MHKNFILDAGTAMGHKNNLVLGKSSIYYNEYNPKVLHPIERMIGRAPLKLKNFSGYDLWRLYEITYLNTFGTPCVATGEIIVPADSTYIIESKSLKLYIGSFTMTKMKNLKQLEDVIRADLSKELECEIQVNLFPVEDCPFSIVKLQGDLIDNEERLPMQTLAYNPDILSADKNLVVRETLRSNILRTLCPVTGQPDHASVQICYEGSRIDRQNLFAYLASLRTHQGFHEQCVELIFSDLKTILNPVHLQVTACFTRRGGIDINPVRTDFDSAEKPVRLIRQ